MDTETNQETMRLFGAMRLFTAIHPFVSEYVDTMKEHYKGEDMNAAKKRRKERARKLTAQRMAEIQAQEEGRKI